MLQAGATSCTQASSKAGSRAKSGKRLHRRGLVHSLSEVMLNASSAAFTCKGPQARKPLQWCKQDTF